MIASRFRREISSFVCEAFFQWAMHLPFGQILLFNNIKILRALPYSAFRYGDLATFRRKIREG